jgi:hypothetical protein
MGIAVPWNRLVFSVTGRPAAKEVLRLANDKNVPAAAIKFTLATSDSRDDRSR